eukprot:CCRYP_016527-RA/>CCRYP_016527-RA protein AED:0.32 eAED:0.32 QI:0/-1/0/1/-1/1/1/0/123
MGHPTRLASRADICCPIIISSSLDPLMSWWMVHRREWEVVWMVAWRGKVIPWVGYLSRGKDKMKFIRCAVTDRQEQRDQIDYRIQSKTIVISETRDVCKASHGRHNSGWKMNGGVEDAKGMGR